MRAFHSTIIALALVSACTNPTLPVEPPPTHESPPAAVVQPAPDPAIEQVVVTANHKVESGALHEQAISADRAIEYHMLASLPSPDDLRQADIPLDRENYTHFDDNPVRLAAEHPVSTFSIDVDTASYSNLRRLLNQGVLPRHDAVRVEELVNYFSYDYPANRDRERPFSIYTEVGPSPWAAGRHLLHIGIQGYDVPVAEIPASNLVFLIDVSGSMQAPNKLELLKTSMKLLARQLNASDSIAIAVYAGAAGVVLDPTPGDKTATIAAAIDRLTAGGSTNGGDGIRLAYALAEQGFKQGGVNRVILATDGDFNVGTVDQQALKNLVADKRNTGVALTVLGFGGGNYNDALMQELAQIGNGNAAYIDTINEARKVLVDERAATLLTIARDVKIQVEFNPALVHEYRLVGYETRHLEREDFNNDKVDAGDIGAGHTVTAIYELALVGSPGVQIDPLRYATEKPVSTTAAELGFLRVRYKTPTSDTSALIEQPIEKRAIVAALDRTSTTYRFSAAVAAFGQILRGGDDVADLDYADIADLAQHARGDDPFGYRGEFLNLVRTADALSSQDLAQAPR